ncbi:succinate dehydrogenase hydrophobic membrane anchor subunit [Rarobacter incanus]|uniref:Succinate dehydrogenase / fumarate reductase membrane anchor subunit n=1 Tax=Rarobacter incanus TaxID=153494 RepID=A0A542SN96_9MICO|nr:succinate dehydrogenase hydrophobic membrane anchor subunit [Rarobacter incanus]TQK76100.1 succinate dehydrogenase / fumarate reductase membrane anchor subunit [Rarobacter incanus]
MSSTVIASPREKYTRKKSTRGNFELYTWVFMRISGVVLVVLIFGHLFVNLMLGKGVHAIDFAFVGGKWSNPLWQVWDLLMLWLAMLHGNNGVRTIINDYVAKDLPRLWLKIVLYAVTAVVVVLGTLVILTFSPCPTGAAADLLPSFCTA